MDTLFFCRTGGAALHCLFPFLSLSLSLSRLPFVPSLVHDVSGLPPGVPRNRLDSATPACIGPSHWPFSPSSSSADFVEGARGRAPSPLRFSSFFAASCPHRLCLAETAPLTPLPPVWAFSLVSLFFGAGSTVSVSPKGRRTGRLLVCGGRASLRFGRVLRRNLGFRPPRSPAWTDGNRGCVSFPEGGRRRSRHSEKSGSGSLVGTALPRVCVRAANGSGAIAFPVVGPSVFVCRCACVAPTPNRHVHCRRVRGHASSCPLMFRCNRVAYFVAFARSVASKAPRNWCPQTSGRLCPLFCVVAFFHLH